MTSVSVVTKLTTKPSQLQYFRNKPTLSNNLKNVRTVTLMTLLIGSRRDEEIFLPTPAQLLSQPCSEKCVFRRASVSLMLVSVDGSLIWQRHAETLEDLRRLF